MRIIYEVGDMVVVIQPWRDWTFGEIAKVIKAEFENAPNRLQLLTLENDKKHEFNMLYEYMVSTKYNKTILNKENLIKMLKEYVKERPIEYYAILGYWSDFLDWLDEYLKKDNISG